jgi:hypothetical protein
MARLNSVQTKLPTENQQNPAWRSVISGVRKVDSLKGRQPGMSRRHPAIFLNVFAVFFTILKHGAPPNFSINSGSMPQVAWNQ